MIFEALHRLDGPEDWVTWFTAFQELAEGRLVWPFVDPDGEKVLVEPIEPIQPSFPSLKWQDYLAQPTKCSKNVVAKALSPASGNAGHAREKGPDEKHGPE